MKVICVDFDGVCHKYSKGYHDGTCYDIPVDGAFDAIVKLQNKGYKVVVLTARQPLSEIEDWFEKHWPGEYGAWPEVTNTKPVAIAYIDDRGIRFTNWVDVLNYF